MAKTENLLAFTREPQSKYKNVSDSIKWAIPIHECLQRPEVKAQAKRLQEESFARVMKEFNLRKEKERKEKETI